MTGPGRRTTPRDPARRRPVAYPLVTPPYPGLRPFARKLLKSAPAPTLADTRRKRLVEHEHHESRAPHVGKNRAAARHRALAPRSLVLRGGGANSGRDALVLAQGEEDPYDRLRWGLRVRAATDRHDAVDIRLLPLADDAPTRLKG